MTAADRVEFERLLQDHIPLAGAMQARLGAFAGESLTVHAPLAANRNHYGTAFGGSIYTVSLLAGWGLASLLLDHSAMIVVEHAQADYKRPITEDLVAVAHPAADADVEAFTADFREHGKARLGVTVQMTANARPAFQLDARFAAKTAP